MITNDFLNHLLVLIVSSFAMVKTGATSLTVSHQIGTNTNFYFRRLNVFPSKLAAIEFSVNFNTSDTVSQLNVCLVSSLVVCK